MWRIYRVVGVLILVRLGLLALHHPTPLRLVGVVHVCSAIVLIDGGSTSFPKGHRLVYALGVPPPRGDSLDLLAEDEAQDYPQHENT